MVLTHRTKDHDFYRTFYTHYVNGTQTTYKEFFNGCRPAPNIYNIVPKGSPRPVSGYYSPVYILNMKGYSNLRVYECFNKPVE